MEERKGIKHERENLEEMRKKVADEMKQKAQSMMA